MKDTAFDLNSGHDANHRLRRLHNSIGLISLHRASPMNITGLHHVTAIASNPQRNFDFYVELLGLRLVKRTVNFDDPSAYYFYFGDAAGTPGTMLTFLPWPDLSGVPVLAVSGRYDPITPMDEALQFVNLLRKGRSESERIVGERRSHDRGNHRGNCEAVVRTSYAETPIFERDRRNNAGT